MGYTRVKEELNVHFSYFFNSASYVKANVRKKACEWNEAKIA